MKRERTGNNKFLKRLNQMRILNALREHGAISKIELSKITGLSPTAIGSITSELQEQGYIHETGKGESKGGRRPKLLELKPRSFYSVGVDFDVDYMDLVLVDITGQVIDQISHKVPKWDSVEKVAEKFELMVAQVIDKYSIQRQKLLGLGVSIPGLVDSNRAEIIMAPNLGWKNINFKYLLNQFKDVPLYIENEAMASAIYESWLGSCRGIENFVCINIKSGIGAGIFINGKLYRGVSGTAGEIGHIVVYENGPRCGCGNYGCVETLASAGYIEQRARKMARQGVSIKLSSFKDIDSISIDDVAVAARNGDEASTNILKESGKYLGIAIASIINMLNPKKIVLGKKFTRYADIVLDTVKAVVECKALKFPAADVEIVASEVGDRASTIGAALTPIIERIGGHSCTWNICS
ncbi:MAG TPA: ROK family transcriptional regulator [Clostridiaceae bacterium]|nr:ROK family transcriptional regulator [Clostridiaceae bacterium]